MDDNEIRRLCSCWLSARAILEDPDHCRAKREHACDVFEAALEAVPGVAAGLEDARRLQVAAVGQVQTSGLKRFMPPPPDPPPSPPPPPPDEEAKAAVVVATLLSAIHRIASDPHLEATAALRAIGDVAVKAIPGRYLSRSDVDEHYIRREEVE